MEEIKQLDFNLLAGSFANDGWVMHHRFMVGNDWKKGDDFVTCYYGQFKLNGKSVTKEFICEMLRIDKRLVQLSNAIAPHPMYSKYAQAFLDGVRWADEHPVNKEETDKVSEMPHQV